MNISKPRRKIQTKKLTQTGLLISFGLVLSWIESFIPMPFPVPGVKPGLANIAVILACVFLGNKTAFLVSIVRVLLAGFLFGSFSSILYALCGAVVSLAVMIVLREIFKTSLIFMSIIGGICHNLAQLVLACFVLATPTLLVSYGPILIVSGTLTGLFVGLVSSFLVERLNRISS